MFPPPSLVGSDQATHKSRGGGGDMWGVATEFGSSGRTADQSRAGGEQQLVLWSSFLP